MAASLLDDAAWQKKVEKSSRTKLWKTKACFARETAMSLRQKLTSASAAAGSSHELDLLRIRVTFFDLYAEGALREPSQASAPTDSDGEVDAGATNKKKKQNRADNYALNKMKVDKALRKIAEPGDVAGLPVGFVFENRAESLVVGVVNQTMCGISTVAGPGGKRYAAGIVVSGGYSDDSEGTESFSYTGQGKNNTLGDKRQIADQELTRGNLALYNSCKDGKPVRVLRGIGKGEIGDRLMYLGLYNVKDWECVDGVDGFKVYKFAMERCDTAELPQSALDTVANAHASAAKSAKAKSVKEEGKQLSIPSLFRGRRSEDPKRIKTAAQFLELRQSDLVAIHGAVTGKDRSPLVKDRLVEEIRVALKAQGCSEEALVQAIKERSDEFAQAGNAASKVDVVKCALEQVKKEGDGGGAGAAAAAEVPAGTKKQQHPRLASDSEESGDENEEEDDDGVDGAAAAAAPPAKRARRASAGVRGRGRGRGAGRGGGRRARSPSSSEESSSESEEEEDGEEEEDDEEVEAEDEDGEVKAEAGASSEAEDEAEPAVVPEPRVTGSGRLCKAPQRFGFSAETPAKRLRAERAEPASEDEEEEEEEEAPPAKRKAAARKPNPTADEAEAEARAAAEAITEFKKQLSATRAAGRTARRGRRDRHSVKSEPAPAAAAAAAASGAGAAEPEVIEIIDSDDDDVCMKAEPASAPAAAPAADRAARAAPVAAAAAAPAGSWFEIVEEGEESSLDQHSLSWGSSCEDAGAGDGEGGEVTSGSGAATSTGSAGGNAEAQQQKKPVGQLAEAPEVAAEPPASAAKAPAPAAEEAWETTDLGKVLALRPCIRSAQRPMHDGGMRYPGSLSQHEKNFGSLMPGFWDGLKLGQQITLKLLLRRAADLEAREKAEAAATRRIYVVPDFVAALSVRAAPVGLGAVVQGLGAAAEAVLQALTAQRIEAAADMADWRLEDIKDVLSDSGCTLPADTLSRLYQAVRAANSLE